MKPPHSNQIVAGLLPLNAHLCRSYFGQERSLLQHWPGLPAQLWDFDEQCCPGSSHSSLVLPPQGLPQPAAHLPTARLCPCSACSLELSFPLHQWSIHLKSFLCEEAFPALARPQGSLLVWTSAEPHLGGEIPHRRCHFLTDLRHVFSPHGKRRTYFKHIRNLDVPLNRNIQVVRK